MAEFVAGSELIAILGPAVTFVGTFGVEAMTRVAIATAIFKAVVETHPQTWIFPAIAVMIPIVVTVAVPIAVGRWGRPVLRERSDAGTTRKRKRNK